GATCKRWSGDCRTTPCTAARTRAIRPAARWWKRWAQPRAEAAPITLPAPTWNRRHEALVDRRQFAAARRRLDVRQRAARDVDTVGQSRRGQPHPPGHARAAGD